MSDRDRGFAILNVLMRIIVKSIYYNNMTRALTMENKNKK